MTHETTPHQSQPDPSSSDTNGLAIASLVLGILSLTGFLFLTGVPAIITGVMSLKKTQRDRGMSIAGIVMGSIATFLSLLILLGVILLVILGVTSDPTFMPTGPSSDSSMPVESTRT
jgi:hypothetical protein